MSQVIVPSHNLRIGLGRAIRKSSLLGAQPWTPAQLANLVLWCRADDFTSAGTVTTWADRAGAGSGTPTSVATFEPAVVLNVLNGKPGVAFAADYLTGTMTWAAQNPGSLFAVAKLQSGAGSDARIIGLAATGNDATQHGFHLRRNLATENMMVGTNSLVTATQAVTYGTPFSMSGIRGATAFTSYLNGVASTPVASSSNMSITRYVIGARANTSTTVSTSNGWSDYIFEVGVVKAELSSTEREKLEGYLHHYWGIAAALSVGHPYKSAPPTI